MECPRNSDFVYGILCDGVVDEILDGIKQGLTDYELNKIIWNEIGLKRGYQLGVRKTALSCIEGYNTEYYSEDDPRIMPYLINDDDERL